MSAGTLDDRYLTWLYGQVADVKTRKSSSTYWDLLRVLYSTEFVWFVPNDDNRVEDGLALRQEWASEYEPNVDPHWLSLSCSFLELLIGIARRLDFESEPDVEWWFWHMIDNLGLLGFHDLSNFSAETVEDRTSAVIWRTYERNGKGGLFPLQKSRKDQRRVEIWYQLSEYLLQHE